MTSIKDFASHHALDVNPASIRKRLNREGFKVSINEALADDILAKLQEWYLTDSQPGASEEILPQIKSSPKPTRINGSPVKNRKKTGKQISFRDWLAILPLPMLGLAASYGVYFFSEFFVPTWVAISEAAAFELTYIGLAGLQGLSEKQRRYALKVSLGALAVSVIYNSIAGALHQDPTVLENLPVFWFWCISILHGAPLAILAYLVADLLFHRK